MKQFLTLAAILLASTSFAQFEVKQSPQEVIIGKCKNGAYTQAELSYKIIEGDTLYTLMYLNAKYSTLNDYQSISFNEEGNTLNGLYSVLKGFFSDEHKKDKDYKVNFKLGNSDVIASNNRMMGITSVMIWTNKGYVLLTEKQVDKVFGK